MGTFTIQTDEAVKTKEKHVFFFFFLQYLSHFTCRYSSGVYIGSK